jgi:hypothetical protein
MVPINAEVSLSGGRFEAEKAKCRAFRMEDACCTGCIVWRPLRIGRFWTERDKCRALRRENDFCTARKTSWPPNTRVAA